MSVNEREEFYVGYLPTAPRDIAGMVRLVVIVLLIAAAAVAVALVVGQHRFEASRFEFGVVKEFEGELLEHPIPRLLVKRNSNAEKILPFVTYALVGQGKHGAAANVLGFNGQRVKLKGTLIQLDDTTMIEVIPGTILPAPPSSEIGLSDSTNEVLKTTALVGEIVDSKCYLGVMNPGHTKPHRECASLCIRGGIPPLFVVKDAEGHSVNLWLVSDTGEPVNQQVLDFVAEPVQITGQVNRSGDQLYLYANPQTIRQRK